jgi:Fe-S-cluster containining protein
MENAKDSPPDQARAPVDPTGFRLPEGWNYSCHHSGSCCEDFWEIPLDDISLARLNSLPLSSVSPKFLAPEHYTERSETRPEGLSLKRASGRCVFLDPARRCAVHGNFGAGAKPQTCQDFPFRYVCTPGGVYVGLSMACPSVRGNRGQAIEDQRAQLAANYEHSLSVRMIADPIQLAPDLPIDYGVYERIEASLTDILAVETLAMEDRLIAGYVLLQLLERAVRELDPEPELISGNIDQLIELFQKDQYRRCLAIARKARGSDRLHRALIGLLITYRAAFDARKRSRFGRSAYLLYQYFRHMGGLGTLLLPPMTERVSLGRMRSVRADWNDPYFVNLINRFCTHSLFRKDTIVATPLLKGYAWLLTYVALIYWYARANTATRGEGQVDRVDMDQAISAVEKYYCFHTDFMRLFDHYPGLGGMVDRLMAKPFFAPSIVRPKGP